jgi:hypothetical protein
MRIQYTINDADFKRKDRNLDITYREQRERSWSECTSILIVRPIVPGTAELPILNIGVMG